MASILNRSSRNFLWRHPWQLALALLGIALGVAVVIAIDLALESAHRSFELAGKALSGRATHIIDGGDGGLDENLYTRLRVEQGVQNLSPVIQGYVALKQNPEERLKLYGIDPLIEKSFQPVWQPQLRGGDSYRLMARLMTHANSVLIGKRLAERLGLNVDDGLPVLTDNGEQTLTLVGFIEPPDAVSEQLLENLMIADIATAQELTGQFGKLNVIEVMLDESSPREEMLKKIRSVLPANVQITAADVKAQSLRQMTEAFSVNLNALGLLSLLLGMFLIYNAMTFLAIQRRSLIGSLRAIGVTRRQIFSLILREALLLALIGTAIGIGVGIIIGQGLLQAVSATIDSVYFRLDAGALLVTPRQIIKAASLGIAATLLAVMPPAIEATLVSPGSALIRSQLESGSKRLIKLGGLFGLLLMISAFAVALSSEKSIRLGLAAIFLLMFGFALLTPAVTLLLMKMLERLPGRGIGILPRLPARLVAAEISRTGIAIAALMIAVATTIGMDLMINSFRRTVSDWIETSLQGDLYIALPGSLAAAGKAAKDRDLKAEIARLPGVDLVSSVLHTQAGPVAVSVFELHRRSHAGFILLQSLDAAVWERFEQRQAVLVTEAYAYRHAVRPGDSIVLETGNGKQAFEIIAVYADYSGDLGHVAMSRRQYLRHWPDFGYTGIGVYARTDADLPRLERAIRLRLSPMQTVQSSGAIHDASMAVFEQTFAVTETLRALAAGIAFVGVFGALTALQFERIRLLGILRAIGLTPGQLSRLIATETGLMGLAAGLFAMPVGYLVAYELIYVVYRRSFGWTMAFHFHPAVLFKGLALAVIAALVAGILPALKMARTKPAEALREE